MEAAGFEEEDEEMAETGVDSQVRIDLLVLRPRLQLRGAERSPFALPQCPVYAPDGIVFPSEIPCRYLNLIEQPLIWQFLSSVQ